MKKILIVVSRYNETNALLLNTIKNLKKNKIKLSVLKVNGAFEIPVVISKKFKKI